MSALDELEELEIPDFLSENDEDDIHEEMLNKIPDEYDKSEGQHLYNFTRPTAHVASKIRGFDLPNAINLIWPRFSYDDYLDLHAEPRGIVRKEAKYSTGTITFTGTPDTLIPAGYMCSTESKNNTASKDYITLEDCEIGEDGTVTVAARASVAGSDGNTAANTVVINSTAYDDVTSVTNTVAFTDGFDEESDESLYARIHEYDSTQGESNTGNPSDYKRWAESVPGTGNASVIRSRDTSGIVTIILTDGNGEPASTSLCQSVYNYIMSPDDEAKRIAPCGALLSVIPPQTLNITISAKIKLKSGTVETVASAMVSGMKEYFPDCVSDGEILYQKVGNILGDIDGVYDYSLLYVNGGQSNVSLDTGVFPSIDVSQITFTLSE